LNGNDKNEQDNLTQKATPKERSPFTSH